MALYWQKVPLLLHATVETIAAASFILNPASQLPNPSVEARLVLQSLGGILLSTNLICVVLIKRPVFDDTSRLVAASLAFWHLWPCRRAWVRMNRGSLADDTTGKQAARRQAPIMQQTLGGPILHLGVHATLLILLLGSALATESGQ